MPSWPSYPELSAPLCVVCCESVVPICPCALFTPGPPAIASPFASYADAETNIANSTADCILWSTGGALVGMSADTSVPDQVTLSATTSGGGFFVLSLNMRGGSILTISSPMPSEPVAYIVLDCFGNNLTGTLFPFGTVNYTVPSDGAYYVYALPFSSPITMVFSCDDTMVANPIVALWDDSGTVRKLDACPKLFLPPLTEATGDWYADEAAGQAALDDETSNCVGYAANPASYATFTATDGGSSLALDGTTGASQPSFTAWGSVNAESGETLSVAFAITASVGTTNGSASIYDYDGALVETLTGSSPLVSSALPYTGRYTVKVLAASSTPTASLSVADFDITSSGVLTVNPVQALYDVGLGCPARLDCP